MRGGIGMAIALSAAADGANIAVAVKTTEPHPRLQGTMDTAVDESVAAGGKGLACPMDIRFEEYRNVCARPIGIVDDVGEGLDVLPLPPLGVVEPAIDAARVQEEERVGRAADRNPPHRLGRIIRHARTPQHDAVRRRRCRELGEREEDVGEPLLAAR